MIEVDGKQVEGVHVMIVRGNNLSWSDAGQCLRVGGEVDELEVSADEFNALMTSPHLLFMSAITTPRHDVVMVFGDYSFGPCDD